MFNDMRFHVPNLLLALCLVLAPAAVAQDEASAQDGEQSLGDLARSLRKKAQEQPQQQPSALPVIDNENLSQVTEDARKARPLKEDKTVLSIDPSGKTLKVSSPDVTCSLSFNARASALLIKPVMIEDLPLRDLLKIDGPGSIRDENLQLQVFNGSDWDLKEITIGLTLERGPGPNGQSPNAQTTTGARVIPAAQGGAPNPVERHSDVTLLYHLKADAKPFTTTTFRENIGITPGPDEQWRWSIVEAKGIRASQKAPSQPPPQQR